LSISEQAGLEHLTSPGIVSLELLLLLLSLRALDTFLFGTAILKPPLGHAYALSDYN